MPPHKPANPALMEYCSCMNFIPYPIRVATINESPNPAIVVKIHIGLKIIFFNLISHVLLVGEMFAL